MDPHVDNQSDPNVDPDHVKKYVDCQFEISPITVTVKASVDGLLQGIDDMSADERFQSLRRNCKIHRSEKFKGFQLTITEAAGASASIFEFGEGKKHYVAFVSCDITNAVYVFDSNSLADNVHLPFSQLPDVKQQFSDSNEFIPVSCPQQKTQVSFCHAFLNSMLILWGLGKYATDETAFKSFIDKFKEDQFVSQQNVDKMVEILSNIVFEIVDGNDLSCEEDRCQLKKDKVDDFIAQYVRECECLSFVVEGLKDWKKSPLDSREESYIETHYAQSCVHVFLDEVENYLSDNIKQVCDDLESFTSYLKNLREIADLEKYFSSVPHCEMMINCKMDKIQTEDFLRSVQQICWKHVIDEVKLLTAEKEFMDALEEYLRQCFLKKPRAIFGGLQTKFDKGKIETYLKNTVDEDCGVLKEIAEKFNYFELCSKNFMQSFQTVINDYLSPPDVKEIEGNVIQFIGRYLDLAEIEQETPLDSFIEVRLFAHQLLLVNSNLTLPGINLAVLTQCLHVCSDSDGHVWDLSGRNGKNNFDDLDRAADGVVDGEDGEAGLHGCSGQSGGNVFIEVERIHHGEKLLIRSNGGRGRDGQQGGNGKKGEDGVDGVGLTEDDFKKRFPDMAYFIGASSSKNEAINLDSMRANLRPYKPTHDETYGVTFTGNTAEGNMVRLGIYSRSFWSFPLFLFIPLRQSYCLVKGTAGTKGKKGGNGGCGGNAGCGGYAGKIQIVDMSSQPTRIETETMEGMDGKKGKDGKGGKGGMNGTKGQDCGRLEHSEKGKTLYYCGNLNLFSSQSSNSRNAWCAKEMKYVVIKSSSNTLAVTSAEVGKDGANKLREKRTQNNMKLRRTPISVDEIHKQFLTSRKRDSYEAFNHAEGYINQVITELQSRLDIEHANQRIKHMLPHSTNHGFQVENMQANYIPVVKEIKEARECKMKDFIQDWENDAKAVKNKKEQMTSIKRNILCLQLIYENVKTESLDGFDIKKLYGIVECFHRIKLEKEMEEMTKEIELALVAKYRFVLLQNIRVFSEDLIQTWFGETSLESNGRFPVEKTLQLNICDFCIQYMTEILQIDKCADLDEYNSKKEDEIEKDIQIMVDFQNAQHNNRDDHTMAIFDLCSIDPNQTDEEDDTSASETITLPCNDSGRGIPNQSESSDEPTQQDFAGELEKMSTCLPKNIQRLILKLKYLDDKDIRLLATVLSKRISIEGLHISYDIFKWLITRVFEECEIFGLSEMLLIFGTAPQDSWLLYYIVQQLQGKMFLPYSEQIDFRRRIASLQFHNHDILLFLSQQLVAEDSEVTLTTEAVIKILELSKDIKIDDELCSQLQDTMISDWPYRIEWFKMLLKLKKVSTDATWQDGALIEAGHYLAQLTNIHGNLVTDMLVEAITPVSGQHVVIKELLQLLQNFTCSHWILNEKAISIMKEHPSVKWADQLNEIFVSDKSRSIEELIDLMILDSNNTIGELSLGQNKKTVEMSSLTNSHLPDKVNGASESTINNWTNKDIMSWAQKVKKMSKQNSTDFINQYLFEMIAVIDRAIMIKKEFALRDTQKLSIAMFLQNNSGMLQQISTGEGKTLIIAALCIIKALCDENVDVITSSPVLAQRDAQENCDLYDLFGVTVGHNCSELEQERKKVYVDCKVVFGEIGSFQRDLLLDGFYGKELGIGSRKKGFAIVDEVDSMLLDKAQNVLYLSHSIPGMDALEDVYVNIWNFVHGKDMFGTAENVKAVRECMLSAMYGTLRRQDISSILENKDASVRAEAVWNSLVDKGIIDSQGKIVDKDKLLKNQLDLKDIGDIEPTNQEVVLCRLKDIVRQGIHTPVPKYLLGFVNTHLDVWIENAFRARWMLQNDNYIIDIDRSDTVSSLAPNIVIMEKDTGVEKYHLQWSNGLHQFLQLKHGCRLSYESLKAVFMSNVSFFNQYDGRLYGLTGTLGSKRERDLLKEMYDVEYATIPSFRPSRFIQKIAKPCSSESEWVHEVKKVSQDICKTEQRPVLIICESVRDVEKLESAFSELEKDDMHIHIYKRSYEALEIGSASPIDSSCIILATNLAGRGTDIKVSDRVAESGGLHVCLAYLPPSYRVEEQAFGRAARKGQKGSGQMIYQEADYLSSKAQGRVEAVIQHKVRRDLGEERQIDRIKKCYEFSIKKDEELFKKFRSAYQTLKCNLRGNDHGKRYEAIILESCLDEWALLLDEVSIQEADKDIGRKNVETFLNKMKRESEDHILHHLICSPAKRTQLAKILTDQKRFERAEKIFDMVIRDDEYFSEAAHYYKCHLIVKGGGRLTKATIHLHKAEELFKGRIEKLSYFASMVPFIAKQYKTERESFLHANDFAKQKEDMIQIYSAFLRSLQAIVGCGVTQNALCCSLNNPVLAEYTMDHLLLKSILKSANITSAISAEQRRILHDTYKVSSRVLDEVLSNSQNTTVTADTFRNILPSREEFWEQMIKAGLFFDEKEYMILEKAELEKTFIFTDVFWKYKDEICCMEGCDDFKDFNTSGSEIEQQDENSRSICLFPEQLENIKSGRLTAIPSDEFMTRFGCHQYVTALKQKGILKVNKICHIREDKTTRLEKYDSLHEDVFSLEIDGIDCDMSHEIFQSLQESKIISNDAPYARLLVSDVTADGVALTCHRNCETEILNVIATQFRYRLALSELMQGGQINLESEPHRNVYDDLVVKHIIEPVKVNESLSDCQIVEDVHSLFDGTFGKSELRKICAIDEKIDVEALWTHLLEKGWIKKIQEQGSTADLGEICEDFADKSLPDLFRSVEHGLKVNLECAVAMKVKSKTIESHLLSWKSGLSKYDQADSNLIDVYEQFDMESIARMSDEFTLLQSNGLNHIIALCEEKWTIWAVLKIVAISIIGLAQIALGVIIELYTVGAGTKFAAGLISEGMGDIMFAIESAGSGYCTWEAYANLKAQSFWFSVLTAGVGAFFSRGAQYSRYGYKIGGDFLRKVAGKQLIKEAGKNVVQKAIVCRAMKKIVEAGVVGLANVGVERTVQNMLDTALGKISKEVVETCDGIEHHEALMKILQELCQKVGVQRAEAISKQISEELYNNSGKWHRMMNKICTTFSRVGSAVSSGLAQASKHLSRSGNKTKMLSTVAKGISDGFKGGAQLKAVGDVISVVEEFTSQLEEKLNDVNKKTPPQDGLDHDQTQTDDFCKRITKQWKNHLVSVVQQKLSSEVVQPILRSMAQKIVTNVGISIQNCYAKLKTNHQYEMFSELRARHELNEGEQQARKKMDEYFVALIVLQKKVKDPHLFAEIIREGGPSGIHCVQAIAEYLQRPVVINTVGGDDKIRMPERFDPRSIDSKADPIVLNFHIGEKNLFGHFTDPNSAHSAGDAMNNDCLFEAVSAQIGCHIDREKIADIVENDPWIKDRIKQGIHDHFLGKGASGGVERQQKKQKKLDELLSKLRTGHGEKKKLVDDLRRVTRDKAEPDHLVPESTIKKSGTGNDEIFQTASTMKWYEKSLQERKTKSDLKYDFLDCHVEIRVDTRYVIWELDGSIQGHTGAVRKKKKPDEYIYCTKGQPAFHKARETAIGGESTAQKAAVVGLAAHLSKVIHPNKLKEIVITNKIYTNNGHDLSNPDQKKKYHRGYEREWYKNALVAMKLNNGLAIDELQTTIPQNLCNDYFMKDIREKLERIDPHDIKSLGVILRKPAPE